MRQRTQRRSGVVIPALVLCFCAGIMVGWWLRAGAPMPAVSPTAAVGPVLLDPADSRERDLRSEDPAAGPNRPTLRSEVAATTGEPLLTPAAPTSLPAAGVIGDLRRHNLRLPIADASVDLMKGGFDERRDAGGRPHEAVDMLAARNTPVRAVEDGTIAKLFTSKAGGTTIYQFDPSGAFCYYYAHLERYAPGLHDGQHVSQGEVIGFVGTSGNAPPNTPHLHFAVFELDADHHWWKGRAIDPYLIFRP